MPEGWPGTSRQIFRELRGWPGEVGQRAAFKLVRFLAARLPRRVAGPKALVQLEPIRTACHPRFHMISAETSESRQPLRGRYASLDTSAAAKDWQLRRGAGDLDGGRPNGALPAAAGLTL